MNRLFKILDKEDFPDHGAAIPEMFDHAGETFRAVEIRECPYRSVSENCDSEKCPGEVRAPWMPYAQCCAALVKGSSVLLIEEVYAPDKRKRMIRVDGLPYTPVQGKSVGKKKKVRSRKPINKERRKEAYVTWKRKRFRIPENFDELEFLYPSIRILAQEIWLEAISWYEKELENED